MRNVMLDQVNGSWCFDYIKHVIYLCYNCLMQICIYFTLGLIYFLNQITHSCHIISINNFNRLPFAFMHKTHLKVFDNFASNISQIPGYGNLPNDIGNHIYQSNSEICKIKWNKACNFQSLPFPFILCNKYH